MKYVSDIIKHVISHNGALDNDDKAQHKKTRAQAK
jgi:hypothetical protein